MKFHENIHFLKFHYLVYDYNLNLTICYYLFSHILVYNNVNIMFLDEYKLLQVFISSILNESF